MQNIYNDQLRKDLIGKKLRRDMLPVARSGQPMFSFWGEDIGIPTGDIHRTRAYRIYVEYDDARIIQNLSLMIEGELISPCSGYHLEVLDEFDYPAVRDWCFAHLEPDSIPAS